MKGRKEFEIRWKPPDFPRFSQKGAGKSARQVQGGKRFGAVSTDSQASSQQQGFMVLFFRIILLQKKLWLWILQREAKWEDAFGGGKHLAEAHFHSAASGSGFILFQKTSRVRA